MHATHTTRPPSPATTAATSTLPPAHPHRRQQRTIESLAAASTQHRARSKLQLDGVSETVHRLQRRLVEVEASRQAEVAALVQRLADSDGRLAAAASEAATALSKERAAHRAGRRKDLDALEAHHAEHLALVNAHHARDVAAVRAASGEAVGEATRRVEVARAEVAAMKLAHQWQLRAREKSVREALELQLGHLKDRLAGVETASVTHTAAAATELAAMRAQAERQHVAEVETLMAQHKEYVVLRCVCGRVPVPLPPLLHTRLWSVHGVWWWC